MPQKFQITRAAELESLQEIRAFITDCCAVLQYSRRYRFGAQVGCG